MKKIILLTFQLFITLIGYSQNFEWAHSIGGTGTDRGTAINTDPWGNVYITGFFSDSFDFDPGLDTFNISSNGGFDLFVQKLDSSGNFIWL